MDNSVAGMFNMAAREQHPRRQPAGPQSDFKHFLEPRQITRAPWCHLQLVLEADTPSAA